MSRELGSGRRRRRRRIALWSLAGVLTLVLLAGVAVYLRLNGNLHVFDAGALSKDRPSAGVADAQGRIPVNVLIIGSDSRGGGNQELGGGVDGGARSDTAILLHIYADHRHAVAVSIPRDSLVDIPPCRLPDGNWTRPQTNAMFNSAFSVGGTDDGNPACSQNTVEKLTGLRVDHTVVVTFQGFAAMTTAVGGVEVCVPKPVYQGDLDPNLGNRGRLLFPQGLQKVQGQSALDYVRVRHGIGDGSDIGRMKRQQAFLASLVRTVKAQGMNPATLLPLADAVTRSITVDPGLDSPAKLMSFVLSLRNIGLHDIKFLTAPWRYQGARVALVKPDVDLLWAALRADRTLDGQDAGATAGPAATAAAVPVTGSPSATGSVGALPSGIGAGARSADDDLCSDVSYG